MICDGCWSAAIIPGAISDSGIGNDFKVTGPLSVTLPLFLQGPIPIPSIREVCYGLPGLTFEFFRKPDFNNLNGMASLGILNLLWIKLLVRFLIKERINFLGMQSLKYKGPIPIPSLRAGKGVPGCKV